MADLDSKASHSTCVDKRTETVKVMTRICNGGRCSSQGVGNGSPATSHLMHVHAHSSVENLGR